MKRRAGFGSLEFAMVLLVFGVLAGALLNRLLALEYDAERLAVDLTVRHIGVGLKLAVGERIMRGEEAKIAALLDENPLDFLGDANVGAGGTADVRGAWHYDPATHVLSYRPRLPAAFGGRETLEWRLRGFNDELGRAVGLRLEPLK